MQKKRWLKIVRNAVLTITVLGLIGTGTGIWFMADKMVTPKRRGLSEWHQKILSDPTDFGLTLEPFTASNAEDGTRLSALLVSPSETRTTAKKRRGMEERLQSQGFSTRNRGLVLLVHGRSGIKEDALPITERFVAAGFHCVIFDSRAHGESDGRFCTYGKMEVGDALAVLEAAREKAGLSDSAPVFGFGYSLGAAVMMQTLAGSEPICAAAVIAPFADLEELIVYSGGKFSADYLPDLFAKAVIRIGEMRAGFQAREIQPLSAASQVNEPVLVVHGELDRVIPVAHGRRIFEAIPNESKRWREVEWAYHGNVLAEGGDDLYEEILRFFLENSVDHRGNDTQSAGRARFSNLQSRFPRKFPLNEPERNGNHKI